MQPLPFPRLPTPISPLFYLIIESPPPHPPQPRLGSLRTAFTPISVRTDPKLGSRGWKKGIATFLVKIKKQGCPNRDRVVSGSRLGRVRLLSPPNAVAGGGAGETGAVLHKCLRFRWTVRAFFAIKSCRRKGCCEMFITSLPVLPFLTPFPRLALPIRFRLGRGGCKQKKSMVDYREIAIVFRRI